MKKISILFAMIWLFGMTAFSQDEGTAASKENNNKSLLGYFMAHNSRPEYLMYENSRMIDNQTCVINPAKTLEVIIQHRFGTMDNGISDLWGVFGAANTRLGLDYSITDWLQVEFGTTKFGKIQDFGLKVNLLQQSKDKKIPLSVTYYGNMAINATEEKNFGADYKFIDRLSYFNEAIITRKFTKWLTLSAGISFTHFNKVDTVSQPLATREHDKVALHFLGRFKLTEESSIIINYDWPLIINSIKEWPGPIKDPPKPNFGIGWEIQTVTHTFQIVLGTSTALVPQYTVMRNQNDFTKGDLYLGFNITRMWNF